VCERECLCVCERERTHRCILVDTCIYVSMMYLCRCGVYAYTNMSTPLGVRERDKERVCVCERECACERERKRTRERAYMN